MPRAERKQRREMALKQSQDACPLCPSSDGSLAAAAARCTFTRTPCVHEVTDAARSVLTGLACMNGPVRTRGFFVASLSAAGSPVCTGGDRFHAWAASPTSHFAMLSQPVSPTMPNVYWFNASATAVLPGSRTYLLTVSLVESMRRTTPGPGVVDAEAERARQAWSLEHWARWSECVWRVVGAAETPVLVHTAGPASQEPECGALPAASGMAYVALQGEPASCGAEGALCVGDAATRLINSSNGQRLRQRSAKGFNHILKPVGCRFRLRDEADVQQCLRGRRLLNIGSAVAVDLQRGFARLNRSLVAWTRRRPGTTAEQRVPFHKRLPQFADFHCARRAASNPRLLGLRKVC